MANINFDDYHKQKLQNPEYVREWLRTAIYEYINGGDYDDFFSDLEDVIKANSTVKAYAKKVNMSREQLIKILHGKTKTPNLATIRKIVSGLGYDFECKIELQPKSA